MKNIIISLLNRYLEQDLERADQLSQINGKIIRIMIKEVKLDLFMQVYESYVQEVIQQDITADVEINLSLAALPDYLTGADADKLIKNGTIEIKGDAHIASVLQNTLKEIEVDWEEIISKYTGDAVAYQIGKGARVLQAFSQRMRDNFRQDLRDYLQDNVQVSATQAEVDQFVKDVDGTRAQADRLEARLARLEQNKPNNQSQLND